MSGLTEWYANRLEKLSASLGESYLSVLKREHDAQKTVAKAVMGGAGVAGRAGLEGMKLTARPLPILAAALSPTQRMRQLGHTVKGGLVGTPIGAGAGLIGGAALTPALVGESWADLPLSTKLLYLAGGAGVGALTGGMAGAGVGGAVEATRHDPALIALLDQIRSRNS